MDLLQAREIITAWSKQQFGALIEVREVGILRRASGRVWIGELYCSTKEGDISVGSATIDEDGCLVECMDVDQFIDHLVSIRMSNADGKASFAAQPAISDDDFSDLSMEVEDDFSNIQSSDDRESVFDTVDHSVIQEMIITLVATGEQEKLLEARNLLPQLLCDQQKRGNILWQMGKVELLLGETNLGLNYLYASSEDFANLADEESLNNVANLIFEIVDENQDEWQKVKRLQDGLRARLRTLEELHFAPLFIGLGDEEVFNLNGIVKEIEPAPLQEMMVEGTPADTAFVIKSGALSIRIETPNGETKIVRSCFPGEFIGESSVLGDENATCTATVVAEGHVKLWEFNGKKLRDLCFEYPEIGVRIESAKTLHQLDSFISTHDATSSLQSIIRDQLLGSISGMEQVSAGTIINPAGDVPQVVHLIAEGKVVYRVKDQVVREYESDTFAGLRDTLHELPLEGDFVAKTNCTLVKFDTESLKKIADEATPEVVAVLEKME